MNKKFSEAGIRILEVLSQNPKSPSYTKCIDKISNVSVKHTILILIGVLKGYEVLIYKYGIDVKIWKKNGG